MRILCRYTPSDLKTRFRGEPNAKGSTCGPCRPRVEICWPSEREYNYNLRQLLRHQVNTVAHDASLVYSDIVLYIEPWGSEDKMSERTVRVATNADSYTNTPCFPAILRSLRELSIKINELGDGY